MSQFEQEIRTSLATIQSQLAAVQTKADGAAASVGRIGTAAKGAAAGTYDLAANVGKIGSAAGKAGGPVAGMIASMGGLAVFNPIALLAGTAIAGITAAVYGLVESLKAANAEKEALTGALAGAGASGRSAAIAQVSKMDTNQLRYGVDSDTMAKNLDAFAKDAPKVKLNDRQKLQVSLGMGDMDPADFELAMQRRANMPSWQAANDKESREAFAKNVADDKADLAVRVVTNQATAQERGLFNVENSDVLRQMVEEQRKITAALLLKGSKPGFHFGNDPFNEQAVRESEAKISAIYDQAGASR